MCVEFGFFDVPFWSVQIKETVPELIMSSKNTLPLAYRVCHILLSNLSIIFFIHLFSIYVGLNSSSANVSCFTDIEYK